MAVTPDSVVPGTRLLVVEDEPAIQDMLAMSLAFVGYDVLRASTGAEAVAHADRTKIDLALLDVMLPDTDGVDLLRQLRKVHPDMAAVFVTARDALEDRLAGLTLGGDDYVTKPFSLEEVVARVGVVLRRTRPATRDESSRLAYADLELDEARHEVHRAGELIALSPTEFALLRFLMRNAELVMSRAQILDHVWHYDFNGNSGVVESYISYLRRKVDVVDPPLIHTVRGVGYVLKTPSA
ncbi:response regulator transcription factor [Nocardioides pelophilus]|uniref:response regulator transcription factor n=1 Tax=Nocardioides pelophilus TaxID=2172019 RepID=UPI00160024A0|nr:response regulator transcription factor [Nocardioides pelophilus]